jgi:hypothetical protein
MCYVPHAPIIQNLNIFQKAVRITALTNPQTGKTKKAYNLIYGFRGNGLYITDVNNIQAAYDQYKAKFEYFDHFIPTGSFLLNFRPMLRKNNS